MAKTRDFPLKKKLYDHIGFFKYNLTISNHLSNYLTNIYISFDFDLFKISFSFVINNMMTNFASKCKFIFCNLCQKHNTHKYSHLVKS